MKFTRLLLACDLDRTVLPNGPQPLSEEAIPAFEKFVSQPEVILAYLSGRNLGLIKDSLRDFKIPMPDIAVGDVGTTMYFHKNGDFEVHEGWIHEIENDWGKYSGPDIHKLVSSIKELTLQEPEKQNTFKQSYYTPVEINKKTLIYEIQNRLKNKGIKAAVIFSVDEMAHTGLLDILPASATKKHALEYLHKHLNLSKDEIIFAGDSGNDIEPLTSGYKAILVNNARKPVRQEVQEIAEEKDILSQIYFAKGNFQEMNGNYIAGILEGLNYFGCY